MRVRSFLHSVLAWLAGITTALGGPTPTDQALEAASRLVIGQCRRASLAGGSYWTSQPGALRTFERGKAYPLALYKLFSSPEQSVTDLGGLAADHPGDWAAHPDRWVDLNGPITTNGETIYPIADPRSDAEGFRFDPADAGANPLPMPVAWMYLTRDGTVGWLDAERRFIPMSNPRTGRAQPATIENPLVARLAWWADDATCKLNLNTASEGVFWDTPRCDTIEERAYGTFQPARGEWQRDMGHPAAVSLSSVLFPGQRLHLPGTASTLAPMSLETARLLWRAAPGIPDSGSLGGTVAVNPGREGAVEETISSLHHTPAAFALNADLPEGARTRCLRGGFFLTTHSRAPDYTRDGRPRLSLWPLKSPDWRAALETEPSSLNEFDTLMAAVSTLPSGDGPQRWPMAVVREISDFRFGDVYALENGHNNHLANALGLQMARLRVGSARFGSKYGEGPLSDLMALIAASFSYIRDVNVSDPWSVDPFAPSNGSRPGDGQVTPMHFSPAGGPSIWTSATRPLPKGLGRFPTVSEVALLVSLRHRTRAGESPIGFYGDNQSTAAYLGSDYDHFEVEVGLLIEGFVPAQGGGFSPRVSFALAGYSDPSELSQTIGTEVNIGRMSLNGRPLVFTTQAAASGGPQRSTASSPPTGSVPPERWNGQSGTIGIRFLRDIIAFKPILFSLPAGSAVPRLAFSGTPTGVSENHLRLLLADTETIPAVTQGADTGDLVQVIPLAFPEIRDGPPMPFLDPTPIPLRDGPAPRMARARASGTVLGPEGVIHAGDIVQSLVPNHGDFRLVAAKAVVLQGSALDGRNNDARLWPTFVAHPNYGRIAQAHAFTEPDPLLNGSLRLSTPYAGVLPDNEIDAGYFDGSAPGWPDPPHLMAPPEVAQRPDFVVKPWTAAPLFLVGTLATGAYYGGALSGGRTLRLPAVEAFHQSRYDRTGPDTVAGPFRRGEARPDFTGDFDNGIARTLDGPYVNASDPGDARAWASGGTPYFDQTNAPWVQNPGTYSPYRQIPSAMMLGSLPTGIQSNVPWQTVLFRPDPARGTTSAHYGSRGPADHLFADYFRMPVVKPSSVVNPLDPGATLMPSDTFSTEGRINLNFDIIPFAHIHRSTAMHALFKAQKILAIPDEAGPIYKTGAGARGWRHHIDATETLRQWKAKFATGEVFRTASEIAEQWLVPEGASLEQMPAFWARHRLTGDNSKERPYANLYPHLTTRSFSYDLHVVVEAIEKTPASPQDVFVPGADAVSNRVQRVLKIIGRIDPSASALPDYAGSNEWEHLESLDAFVHWSTPDLAPPPSSEPEWREVGIEETGELKLSWQASPDQICVLESSTDSKTWTVVDAYRTGLWRNTVNRTRGVLEDPRLATVYLPTGALGPSVLMRLRWSPP